MPRRCPKSGKVNPEAEREAHPYGSAQAKHAAALPPAVCRIFHARAAAAPPQQNAKEAGIFRCCAQVRGAQCYRMPPFGDVAVV